MVRSKRLSAAEVAALRQNGDYYVDRNLWVQIRDGGRTKSWIFRYRINGRLRRMGLGPVRLLTLDKARRKAIGFQQQLLDGIDPMDARADERRGPVPTFEDCSEAFVKEQAASWTNDKHRWQWKRTLEIYASPVIGALPVDQITSNHIMRILEPIWLTKTETADRVRSRIERILDWARVAGHREGPNPATWKGELEYRLPAPSKVQRIVHHPAVPHAEAPAVFAKLAQVDTTVSKALRFVALTAVRVGEALGATWSEFEFDEGVWAIPAGRTKLRRPHRVPLSKPALDILQSLRREDTKPDWLVFHGPRRERPVSDASLRKLLRKHGPDDATTHGWRSTFRDWCAEKTDYPREVAEAALAHTLGSKVETAYLRSDLFSQRVNLMADWASYVTGQAVSD